MKRWRTFRRSSKIIREHVGLRRFLKLADPYLGKEIDRIQPGASDAVLIIAPHADDEVLGCGGAFALHRQRGDLVHVVYTTDSGRPPFGKQYDSEQIERRKQEAAKGLQILGGATSENMGLSDGNAEISDAAIEKLAQILKERKPTRIYVPWALDNHRDHRAAFQMLARALDKGACADSFVWQYEVWTPLLPNRYVPIASVIEIKEKAMRAHASQLAERDYVSSSVGLAHFRGLQGNVNEPAEAYFALPAGKLKEFQSL